MFIKFAQDKTNYQKGQIFPFLIMILVAVIILVMITVNLGKIALFKTDVSNAADAAALAAASVLSGTLLGFGLTSDMMCGEMIITLVIVIIEAATIIGIPVAIATYIAWWIGVMCTYIKSLGDGRMAWSNAKKTALQYAFNNAGVDEPRPTFEQFLRDAYGVSDPTSLAPGVIRVRYDEYLKCESTACRNYGRSGFSKFMDNYRLGFAEPIGDIRPGRTSPVRVISGYGWSQRDDASFINSFEQDRNYIHYRDWVEVEVLAGSVYSLGLYCPISLGAAFFRNLLASQLNLPWWLEWLANPVSFIFGMISWIFDAFLPGSLTMDHSREIDNSPVNVIVRRYKAGDNVGLWRFQYGTTSAIAAGRAFRETGQETIQTVCLNLRRLFESLISSWDFDMFETDQHLFETELTMAY
jgi:hypothetical protein